MDFAFTPPVQASVPIHGSDKLFPVHRIYCVGRNYAEHAKEMGFTGREEPFFFMKPADAVVAVPAGSVGRIAYPPKTANLHHEIELVVAIGKGGANITVADAPGHIWGYAVGLDMTRRDLQQLAKDKGRPWDTGKSYDQSAPIGPLYPKSITGEIVSGAIWLTVNGADRQRSDVSKLIWSVAETIAALSEYFTLQPGDLIYSGTPEGVAAVKAGDTMIGGIDQLGSLSVHVG